MPTELTFAEAFDIVWEDVADSVYQYATPLQALQFAVAEIEPTALDHMLTEDDRVWEAYQVVRDAHGICRRCYLRYDGTKPRGGHAVGCTLAD